MSLLVLFYWNSLVSLLILVLVASGLFYSTVAQAVLYFFLIIYFGPTSGGHFNPLITCATMANGTTSVTRGIVYFLVQTLGAVTAEGTWMDAMGNSHTESVGTCGYSDDSTISSSFYYLIFVIVIMLMYILAIDRIAFDKRHSSYNGPIATAAASSILWGFMTFIIESLSVTLVFIVPNPAVCIASYNAYNRSDLSDHLNTGIGVGMSWLGMLCACGVYTIIRFAIPPSYTVSDDEELSRNAKRLRIE